MLKTILVLPDGTEVSSGPGQQNAVQSCTFTECVNSGTELTLGSVCAAMVELTLITPDGGLSIAAGDEITVYKDDGTTRRKLGIFIAEKPQRPNAHTMKLTAYDRVTRLDRDMTGWLAALTDWPYSLYDLAGLVCDACGLELVSTELPNGSFPVQKFSAQGITGRQIMQWIGQVAGRFCRATAEGQLEFAWYPQPLEISYEDGTLSLPADTLEVAEDGTVHIYVPDLTLTSDGSGTVTLSGSPALTPSQLLLGGLELADYTVAPVEKVQLRSGSEDVGILWPNDTDATNTYQITGNLLLSGGSTDALQAVAQSLYEQLQRVTYTPCTLQMPAGMDIRAGQVLSVTDRNGRTITAYVMTKRQTGQQDIIECTGSHRRDSVTAVNEQSYSALSGKVLNLRTDIDGLRAENAAADGRMAALALTVDGIESKVTEQSAGADKLAQRVSTLEQTASEFTVKFQSVEEGGVSKVTTETGYVFDKDGLTISRAGQSVENRLDHTGMFVTRSGQTVLQANDDGVAATDVQVNNFLCIGDYARFENYGTGRTACFWTGG